MFIFFQLINMTSVSNDWRCGSERMFKHAQVCNMDHAGLGSEVRCVGWRGSEVCREVPGTFSSGCGVHIFFFSQEELAQQLEPQAHSQPHTCDDKTKSRQPSAGVVAASQTRAPRRGARGLLLFLQAVEHA